MKLSDALHMAQERPDRQLPEKLDRAGLLVGWSLESEHHRQPIGFSFGDPDRTPESGYVDPVLMEEEGHLITIAPTGAGKGIGCIIPALLRHQGPVIIVDPKGENAMVTARRRKEMGQQVVVLDPMGITGLKNDCFNPLDLITPDTATGVDDASALISALLPSNIGGSKNQYWANRGGQLLLAVVLHVATDLPKEKQNLNEVRKIINRLASNPDEGAKLLGGSRHPEAIAIAENLRIGAPETLGGIISFAQEGVDFLRGPLLQKAIETSTFDPDAVTRGSPLTIYIVLPPHMLESHARFLRLWISGLLTLVMRRRSRPPQSTLFIIDEAAQLGTLAQLRQSITLLRGYGLLTWSFWQDVSQLQHLYPDDWRTMVNNCRVIQAFGANNLTAASTMADLMGFISGRGLLDLHRDEILLQIAGDEAVIAQRPNYLVDPIFKGRFDPNRLFDSTNDPMPSATKLRKYLRPEKRLVDKDEDEKIGKRAVSVDSAGGRNAFDEYLSQWLLQECDSVA